MDIAAFIRNLLPTFGKKDVREKLRIISRKISDIVQPCLELFLTSIDEKSLVSAYGIKFKRDLLAILPPRLRNVDKPYGMVLTAAMSNASKLVDLLETYITKNLSETINIEGMTYQKASVIRLIELLDFTVDYAGRQLAYLVASETNVVAFERPDGKPYTQAEMNYILNNQATYFRMLDLLNGDPKKTFSTIESIPEIVMGDMAIGEVPALAGASADPLLLGAIPGISNIFHWVGIRVVDYEVERYECALKQKRDIELRLESLKQRRLGNLDAQTESIIEGYERELTLSRAKIARFEEKAR